MENRFRIDPKQPKVATSTLRRETIAAQMRAERTTKRQDRFNVHRPVIQVTEPVKDSRAQRLEFWKAERDRKNAINQRKPFVVGVVHHHAGSPYANRGPFTKKVEPVLKAQQSKIPADVKVYSAVKVSPVMGRVTRAMTKAQKQKQPDINKKPKDNQFAPLNFKFKFKAPKGVSALPMKNDTKFKDVTHVFPVSRTPREAGIFGEKTPTTNNMKQKAEKWSAKQMTSTPVTSRKFSPNKKALAPADGKLPNATTCQMKTDVSVYREELDMVVKQLESLCTEWSSIGDKINNIPTEVADSINVAVGQTKLLIREKIAQYRGLINTCEANAGPVPVTESDLKGFWDMVDLQVLDVTSKFEKLAALRENNWVEAKGEQNSPRKRKKKSALKPKQKPVKSAVRDHIAALRRAKEGLQDDDSQKPEVLILQHVKTPGKDVPLITSYMKENISYQSPVVKLVRMRVSENLEKTKRRSSVLMRVTNQMKELPSPDHSSQTESNIGGGSPLSSRKSGNSKENSGQNKKQRKTSVSENIKQDMFSTKVVLEDCAAIVQNTPSHRKSAFKNKFSGADHSKMIASPPNKSTALNEGGLQVTPPLKTYGKSPVKGNEESDAEKQFDQLKGTPVFKHTTPKRTPCLRSSHRL